MADDQSEHGKKVEEDLNLWNHRYLAPSIRFTRAQHPSRSYPPADHTLDFPTDLAVRLPDNPDNGGAQWIPRDALLYAEQQYARGADDAERLPGLHSAAPPIAEILADARTRPVLWVDYGNGFPRPAASQADRTDKQTSSGASGSQTASTNSQPNGAPSNLPIPVVQNGTDYSLDALGWAPRTQQLGRNDYCTQHGFGGDYSIPPGYSANHTPTYSQEQNQLRNTVSQSTDFAYAANEFGWPPPNQHFNPFQRPYTYAELLPPSLTQANPGAQGPYGFSNSLPGVRPRGGEISRRMRAAAPAFGLEEQNDSEPEEANPTPTPEPRANRTKSGSGRGSFRSANKSQGRVTKRRRAPGREQKHGPRSSARGKNKYDNFVQKHRKRLENGTADQIAREPQEALDRIAPIAPNGPVPRTPTELNNFLENFWSRGGLATAMAAGATTTSTAAENSIGGNSLSDRAASDGVYDEGDVFDDDDGEFDDEFPAEEDEDAPGEFFDEDRYE